MVKMTFKWRVVLTNCNVEEKNRGNFGSFKSFLSFAAELNNTMETKQKILAKSFELFKRLGMRSVTMDEVAGQCGVSKKTVYQYFEDKESLVKEVVSTMIGKAELCCQEGRSLADNAVHEIFLAMDMVQNMFGGVNPSMMHDLRKYHGGAFALLHQHKQQFMYATIKQNMERGIAEGLYRPEVNVEILTRYQLHNMTVAFEEDVFPKANYTVVDIDAEITLFNLYGLATPKGVIEINKYKQQRQKQ
ncbi:MAG: TetR/AcrR family transcriptional regulator [Bacteroidetes bacterium]|nr:MAG: TetR/AcrR family transcriptional regulator [Bacteroidota bacterium]